MQLKDKGAIAPKMSSILVTVIVIQIIGTKIKCDPGLAPTGVDGIVLMTNIVRDKVR